MEKIEFKSENYKRMFGNRLRKIRNIREMTQEELGVAIGKSGSGLISQVESGKRGCSFETVYKLADVLEVEPSFLASPIEFSDSHIEIAVKLFKVMKKALNPHSWKQCRRF